SLRKSCKHKHNIKHKMKAWVMDCYRKENSVVLWLKTGNDDIKIEIKYRIFIYMKACKKAERFLEQNRITKIEQLRQTYRKKWQKVYAIPIWNLSNFERYVRWVEKQTRYRIPLYNADTKPEQLFLYEHNLKPGCVVKINGKQIIPLETTEEIALKQMQLNVIPSQDIRASREVEIRAIIADNKTFEVDEKGKNDTSSEKQILKQFVMYFRQQDPDVIFMDYGYSRLPYLVSRLQVHNMHCPFNRFDDRPIIYRGGRSFFSYGAVRYQDYALELRGRFLVDKSTAIGNECNIDAIMELCDLTGTRFTTVASRSFGATFQFALVRQLVMQKYLIPYKEKPIDKPLSMFEMLKADRGGHTLDPKLGFHTDVAEIDFASMYPWLIYNNNISADTILHNKGPFNSVPDVPITPSMQFKGIVPRAIKPIIDRRMYYKQHPTAINKAKSKGLKWVLVTSYGYLRFREFKLGLASSHMAICSYARETLLQAMKLAEQHGFEVVHGIVDSLYIKKNGITEKEVREFCKELELMTGIPAFFEGIFKWIVFLASVNDEARPLPATYYGVLQNGEIKARGIELRRRSTPAFVKHFQSKLIESISNCETEQEIRQMVPALAKILREVAEIIPTIEPWLLVCPIQVAQTQYKHNIPQKKILEQLKQKGIAVEPGQIIKFIYSTHGPILPEAYDNNPDVGKYKDLLIRALFNVVQQFGYSKKEVYEMCRKERQIQLVEFQ
ncbi:hypothetical protein KY320_02815, partial [Candidatus Woesearchaeota archaeon]|nr:hypothetical protein [Candidatus Woesearchaeota archaeon]